MCGLSHYRYMWEMLTIHKSVRFGGGGGGVSERLRFVLLCKVSTIMDDS